jgi:hypothetical protein
MPSAAAWPEPLRRLRTPDSSRGVPGPAQQPAGSGRSIPQPVPAPTVTGTPAGEHPFPARGALTAVAIRWIFEPVVTPHKEVRRPACWRVAAVSQAFPRR